MNERERLFPGASWIWSGRETPNQYVLFARELSVPEGSRALLLEGARHAPHGEPARAQHLGHGFGFFLAEVEVGERHLPDGVGAQRSSPSSRAFIVSKSATACW